jgi:hypothetical protein
MSCAWPESVISYSLETENYKKFYISAMLFCVVQKYHHWATGQKVPGLIPGYVTGDFFRGIWRVHVPGVDSAP